ncbi:MAG: hypothetical protein P1S60_16840, partial [Anaerolineae bacterium]|nr:hypothetical protein [Anaerolineae bacterium]
MQNTHKTGIIALYTADVWEHACPTIRVIAPAQHCGYDVVPGVTWQDDAYQINLQVIDSADLVIIQRHFPTFRAAYSTVYARARELGKPVIYELDDLLDDLPTWHTDQHIFSKAATPIQQAVVEADMVICSTQCIADSLSFANVNIRVMPNYIVDEIW